MPKMPDNNWSEVISLDSATIASLHEMNPWWTNRPMEVLPKTRRHLVEQIKRRLVYRLAPIVVVRGSRQIGKTTACMHVISDLLAEGIGPTNILRVQFDEIAGLQLGKDPILNIVRWYEQQILRKSLNESAQEEALCYLFFDEVQNLDNWSTQLKFLVDHHTLLSVVTGSSALRIEQGRDSLAGRINTIEVGPLSLIEIGLLRNMATPAPFLPDNGVSKLKAKSFWESLQAYGLEHDAFSKEVFTHFSERGAYPIAHLRGDAPWELVADQLNETIVKRVIQHDLRIGEKGRKRDAQLLEELFLLCCRYAGQAVGITFLTKEIQQSLRTDVGAQRVNTYLKFLSDTLLVRLIPALEIRLKKKRSDAKLCLADHSLRASWLQEYIPLHEDLDTANQAMATIAGYLAESVTGALFSAIGGLDLSHLPAWNKDPEVDFVLTIGDQRIPVEVKYRKRVKTEDLRGLQWFLDAAANKAPFGVIITKNSTSITDERIIAIPLRHLLLLR